MAPKRSSSRIGSASPAMWPTPSRCRIASCHSSVSGMNSLPSACNARSVLSTSRGAVLGQHGATATDPEGRAAVRDIEHHAAYAG